MILPVSLYSGVMDFCRFFRLWVNIWLCWVFSNQDQSLHEPFIGTRIIITIYQNTKKKKIQKCKSDFIEFFLMK